MRRKRANAMVPRSSRVADFFRQQLSYLAVAAVGAGVFWAIGLQINQVTILVYSVCIGNLTTPPMRRVRRIASGQPFASRFLIFLGALSLVTPAVYILWSAIVFLVAPPSPQTLEHLLRTGWKFPCLVIFVYSLLSFLYAEARKSLERRNTELEQTVERTEAQIELQEQEMERAREIQESLLPREIPQIPGFEIATAWQPARTVGGDYFDVLKLSETTLGVCMADVAGKGVAAALLMANTQAMVRAFARDGESPARVCTRVNSGLCGNIGTGKFVTLFYGVIHAASHTLKYCNAGHTSPIVASGDSIRQLAADGAVLGLFPAWNFEEKTVNLGPGDRMLLFTDGITEAPGPDGQEFGDANLAALVNDHRAFSAAALNGCVIDAVTRFCGGHFEDDATLLAIAVR